MRYIRSCTLCIISNYFNIDDLFFIQSLIKKNQILKSVYKEEISIFEIFNF